MILLVFAGLAGCGHIPRIVELHDPLSAREHFQLALAYEQKKENDLALKEYEEVIRKKSFLEETYTNMANIYSGQGKRELSETYYLKSIQANPHYGKAYNNLAWIYITENKSLQRAETLLLQAIENDPDHSASYLDTLGTLYEKKGQWERALDVMSRAESLGFNGEPVQEKEFLNHFEKILLSLKRTSEAERIHEKIIEMEIQSPENDLPPVHENAPSH